MNPQHQNQPSQMNSMAQQQYMHSPSHSMDDGTQNMKQHSADQMAAASAPAPVGHRLSPSDPDNPMNWPLSAKLHTTVSVSALAYAIAFTLTSYTSTITQIQKAFSVSLAGSILPFSIFLFGIALSPIPTPHLSERFGRRPVYYTATILLLLFVLGSALSTSPSALYATRFFAGATGGPILVLIEGTYADIWSADATITYYSFLTLSSFLGAASGPLITNFVVPKWGWQWSHWLSLIITAGCLLFSIGMRETYGREILRSRARARGQTLTLPAAQSGVTLGQMATHTLLNPLKQLVTEPIVLLLTINLAFVFALIFQFFITIPITLSMAYMFMPYQVGLAFISAILGSLLAVLTAFLLDLPSSATRPNHITGRAPHLEYRLRTSLVGSVLVAAGLLWVAFTAKPTTQFVVPIAGTGVFIWGCVLTLTGSIGYLFDAYTPAGTLSALTVAAVTRIICGGVLPLVMVPFVMAVGGQWAVATFGFIGVALVGAQGVLFFWGRGWREGSKYHNAETMMVGMKEEGGKMMTGAV